MKNYDQNFATLGVDYKTHKNKNRVEDDFYATDPNAINSLLQYEDFNHNIWECACGNGFLSQRLKDFGYNVFSSDIVNRGYEDTNIQNFLQANKKENYDIITNPPYTHANEFVLKAIELADRKVAMFLKIQFLETQKRYNNIFIKYPPSKVYIFSKRIRCFKNGNYNNENSAVCYCWYIWDNQYKGDSILKWIPPK